MNVIINFYKEDFERGPFEITFGKEGDIYEVDLWEESKELRYTNKLSFDYVNGKPSIITRSWNKNCKQELVIVPLEPCEDNNKFGPDYQLMIDYEFYDNEFGH